MSGVRQAWRNIDAAVIGASAGGVEVLSLLLPRLPAACSASFFVVVHVRRERPSLLSELFAERCAVCVKEAEDKEPVEPGTVYFAPPDYHLLIERGPVAEVGHGGPPDPPITAGPLGARLLRSPVTSPCTSRGHPSTCCSRPPRRCTGRRSWACC